MANAVARPDLTADLAEGLQGSFPPHISIMGQRFSLVVGGEKQGVETFDPKLGPYLDCVIVDVNAKVSQMYYEQEGYDPDSPAPPDCFSDNGVAPSTQAQSPQSHECGVCPKHEWGSATSKVTGRGIPACRSYKKIAVLIPGYGDMAFLLAIPPNSLKLVQAYSLKVKSYNTNLTDIVTRVSFQAGTLGTLVFDAVAHADDEMKGLVDQIWSAGGCPQVVGRNDRPRQLAAPQQEQRMLGSGAAQQAAQTLKPQPQPAQDFLAQQAPKKPRGRPRTVVEAPKNALQQPPAAPFRPQPVAVPQEQTNGNEKFGIAQNSPEPNAELSNKLDSLFTTKFS
jgi:hypothetical protein